MRPDRRRSDRGFADGFDSPSDDGGLDEFREFFRDCASSSSTREASTPTCPRIPSTSDRIASTAEASPSSTPTHASSPSR